MEIMLDKKKIQVNFLINFKVGCKAAETAHSINKVFGPVSANELTVQKCCKGD